MRASLQTVIHGGSASKCRDANLLDHFCVLHKTNINCVLVEGSMSESDDVQNGISY